MFFNSDNNWQVISVGYHTVYAIYLHQMLATDGLISLRSQLEWYNVYFIYLHIDCPCLDVIGKDRQPTLVDVASAPLAGLPVLNSLRRFLIEVFGTSEAWADHHSMS